MWRKKMFKFLKEDLSVVKQKLNVDHIKDGLYNKNLLFLFHYNCNLDVFKYFFYFCKKHRPNLFLEKDDYQNTFLQCLTNADVNEDVVKFVLKFCRKHYPTLFLEKNIEGTTFLEYVEFDLEDKYRIKFLKINFYKIKYIFKFCKKHYPELFLEKEILNKLTDFYRSQSLISTKYVFKFYIKNFPFLFIYFKPILLPIWWHTNLIVVQAYCNYINKFLTQNFPERSNITNNFIVPLMMEIQN